MKTLTLLILIASLNAAGQEAATIKQFTHISTGVIRYNTDSFPCHHIFVAVLPDSLVWDKTQNPVHIKTDGDGSFVISGNTLHFEPSPTRGKPTPQKIVCILCHKQTEQQIKIVK